MHKRASALQTTRGLLHCPKTTWTLVHERLQIGREFSPTLRKFCIALYCQTSQTEISNQNSIKLTQPNFAKRWTIDCTNNLPYESWGRPSRKKIGGQRTFTFVRFFRLRNVTYDNRARALESTMGLLHSPKISLILVHKRLKTEPEFLPTFTILFCPSPSHSLYAALTATLNETALGLSAAQTWSPKTC